MTTPSSTSQLAARLMAKGVLPSSYGTGSGPSSLSTSAIEVGQRVEVEVYGTSVSGYVIRVNENSVVVDGARIGDLRRLRLGVGASLTFGVAEGAARVRASLAPAREGIALQFEGPIELVNRRAHPRAPIDVNVDVIWMTSDNSVPGVLTANTIDLSAGGARLAANPGGTLPTKGAMTLLTFYFADKAVNMPAKVLAIDDTILRVQFSGPDPEDLSKIDTMVLQHLMRMNRLRKRGVVPGQAGPARS
jgi:hypothetical protein